MGAHEVFERQLLRFAVCRPRQLACHTGKQHHANLPREVFLRAANVEETSLRHRLGSVRLALVQAAEVSDRTRSLQVEVMMIRRRRFGKGHEQSFLLAAEAVVAAPGSELRSAGQRDAVITQMEDLGEFRGERERGQGDVVLLVAAGGCGQSGLQKWLRRTSVPRARQRLRYGG